jgi:hypothetical protein
VKTMVEIPGASQATGTVMATRPRTGSGDGLDIAGALALGSARRAVGPDTAAAAPLKAAVAAMTIPSSRCRTAMTSTVPSVPHYPKSRVNNRSVGRYTSHRGLVLLEAW